MTNETAKQTDININGNVDKGAIIVGDRNQVNISDNSWADKTASELAIKRLKDEIGEIKRSMPDTSEGCLAKTGFWLSTLAVLMFIGGVMTGDGATIAGALATAVAFFAFGSWLRNKEEENNKETLKPYWIAIAEKKKEMEYHEKIVKNK